MDIEMHPVQTTNAKRGISKLSKTVTMRAYEVYSHVYRPQEAMVTNGCRGGFSSGEIIAFLYAYPFPKSEWRTKVDEVFKNMENL